MIEYVLWAHKPEDPEGHESLIMKENTSLASLAAAKAWAISEGFIGLRVQTFDGYEVPDFIGAIAGL